MRWHLNVVSILCFQIFTSTWYAKSLLSCRLIVMMICRLSLANTVHSNTNLNAHNKYFSGWLWLYWISWNISVCRWSAITAHNRQIILDISETDGTLIDTFINNTLYSDNVPLALTTGKHISTHIQLESLAMNKLVNSFPKLRCHFYPVTNFV